MADKLRLEIVTPDRLVLAEQVDEVVLPSQDGYMGVLPGHAPLLAQLDIGEVSYRIGNQRQYLAVSGGYAEVLRESVSVLARTAELAEEIDLERAEQARTRAKSQLEEGPSPDKLRFAEVHLKRAISRIQVRGRRQQ
jgi:F-type H+-transporting ATPase subunit epsilon